MPDPGALIFLDDDADAVADRVGILTDVSVDSLSTVEGDREGIVGLGQYAPGDPAIVGFGKIPSNPDLEKYTCGRPAHTHESCCYDGTGALQCGFAALWSRLIQTAQSASLGTTSDGMLA